MLASKSLLTKDPLAPWEEGKGEGKNIRKLEHGEHVRL